MVKKISIYSGLFLCIFFTACTTGSLPSLQKNQREVSDAALLSRTWRLHADKEFKLNNNLAVALTFEQHKFYGNSGCNQFSGTYQADNEGLIQLSSFAVTKMMCDPDSMQLEEKFILFLSQVNRFVLKLDSEDKPSALRLWSKQVELLFVPN